MLDPNLKVKSNLIKFVLKRQLAEYTIMFADSEEGAWLDKVSKFLLRLKAFNFWRDQIHNYHCHEFGHTVVLLKSGCR